MKIQLFAILVITILILGCIQQRAIIEDESKIITKDPKELALQEADMTEEWLDRYYIRKFYETNNTYVIEFRSNKYIAEYTFQGNSLVNIVKIYPNITEAKEAFNNIKDSVKEYSRIKKADFGTESFKTDYEIVFRYANVVVSVNYMNFIERDSFEHHGFSKSIAENEVTTYARVVEQRVKDAAS